MHGPNTPVICFAPTLVVSCLNNNGLGAFKGDPLVSSLVKAHPRDRVKEACLSVGRHGGVPDQTGSWNSGTCVGRHGGVQAWGCASPDWVLELLHIVVEAAEDTPSPP